MKYTWPFVAAFLWIPIAVCYAETQTDTIKDAEFIITKQKKNKVNQEKRLFFKAPTKTTKSLHTPLTTIKSLTLEDIAFEPAPETYYPFNLPKNVSNFSLNQCFKLGIGSLLLPYLDIALENYSFGKGIWSTILAFIPEVWHKKSREASLHLQSRYGLGAWLLQPNLNYQYAWYKYSDTLDYTCRLHQSKVGLITQQVGESSTQDGQASLNLLKYQDKKISEQLFTLQYKWAKQLENWFIKVTSYNDIASYTNETNKQTRFIISVSPNFYLRVFRSIQLKTGLRMAYHNDAIPGKIPNFDLYPMIKVGYTVTTWLTPYIGIKGMGGSVIPLHLHNIIAKNPFIAPNWKLSHYHECFKLYGGSKGMIASNVLYHLHLAYRQLKNQFRIVSVRKDQIKLAYHPHDYHVLKVTGLVDYNIPNTTLNTTIKGVYYQYINNISDPIWWYYKPRYKLKPILIYRPYPKIVLRSNLHLYGPTVIKDIKSITTKLKRIINLSLGIDYFIFKKFSAFLMVSNLLNRKHISYTGYPDKNINITGGLQYRW